SVQMTYIPVYDESTQVYGFYMTETDNPDQISVKQQLASRISEHQLILENLHDLVASFTPDYHYVWANKSYLEFFGLQHQDQIRGKHIREIMGDDGWIKIQPFLQRVMSGEKVAYDVEVSSASGPRYLEANYIPKANIHGQVDGFYALITNIHELKQAEQSFQESEKKFRAIFDQNTIGVAQIESKTGKFIQINQRYCDITGYSQEQLLGKTMLSVTYPEDIQSTQDKINDLLVNQIETFSIEKRYLRPDSTIIWVNLTVSCMGYCDGETSANLIAVVEDITEHKEDQKAIAQLAAIVESSKDAIMGKSLEGIITSWNNSAERMFGYTAEEAIGQPKAMLLPADRLNEVNENLTRIKRGEMVKNFETMRRCKDGSLIEVALSVSPVRGPDGQLIGAATIARDISEHKRIERNLAESEAWFSGILNIADDAVIAVDESSVIQLFNKGAERIFGYRAEEIIGQSLNTLLPKRFAHNHHAHIRTFAQTSVTARQMGDRSEIYGLRKDGTEFPAEASISKLATTKGLTFTVMLRDITERKETQKAAARLAAIVESSQDAIMAKSLDGIITSWNKSAEDLFGYTAEEAIGQPKSILLPPDRPNEVVDMLARIKNGEEIQNYETVRRHKNGLLIDVALSISPVRDLGGKLIGAATIARDITQRKQAAEQLKETNDRLRKLSRQMEQTKETEQKRIAQELHDEFGQSLSSLKWDLSYLKREMQRKTNMVYLENINTRIDDMTSLLGKTIDATRRIATSLRPPMLDDLGLVPALEWQANDFQQRTGIDCLFTSTASINPDLISTEYAIALYRITQELLTNVLRHAQAAKIKIKLDWNDHLLCLEVDDDGIGYHAPPELPRTSLGLLGIQERAEALSGSFSIHGVSGQGTTAIVRIPFIDETNE
ncbi:MAG: PAS domain S-box protein, partial [Gammaproteobacteria bacterium]|nr:PAS domain S-box protein [Gammaproteobacteria bacterium]